jgi:hypothetical protein
MVPYIHRQCLSGMRVFNFHNKLITVFNSAYTSFHMTIHQPECFIN